MLARELLAGGAQVVWFPVVAERAEAPSAPPGIHSFAGSLLRRVPLHRVEAGTLDLPLEAALTRELRARPADAVVQVGVGARGSPNLLWIAERMGIAPFAVVRGSEVVCQRGDLVDAGGVSCVEFRDAARCAGCCSASWWRRARGGDIQNRIELLVAGLQVARRVLVGEEAEANWLEQVGVPRRVLQVTSAPVRVLVEVLQAGAVVPPR